MTAGCHHTHTACKEGGRRNRGQKRNFLTASSLGQIRRPQGHISALCSTHLYTNMTFLPSSRMPMSAGESFLCGKEQALPYFVMRSLMKSSLIFPPDLNGSFALFDSVSYWQSIERVGYGPAVSPFFVRREAGKWGDAKRSGT